MTYFGLNQALVEDQYRRFLDNPLAVDEAWRRFFQHLSPQETLELGLSGDVTPSGAWTNGWASVAQDSSASHASDVAWRTSRLVMAYRGRGHFFARLDPLGLESPGEFEFTPANFGIRDEDLDVVISTDIPGQEQTTPRRVMDHMYRTYCASVGYELMHIESPEERRWLLERIEGTEQPQTLAPEERRRVLGRLSDALELETFLGTQYIGAKRFSLEGLEALIPALTELLDKASGLGATSAVIGMAHRGRLNVLVNIMQKKMSELFSAFNDADSEAFVGKGDVKYHMGYSTEHHTAEGRKMHLSLCFNPSHLEFVNPVVVGRARARLDRVGDPSGRRCVPVMIHGDAAFIGQGIVSETLNLAELRGYTVGGSVHLVLNNQVGFTTSPRDSRSTRYCTDIMNLLRVPVFHVNAEDLDAVIRTVRLAIEYRQTWGRDVCIDFVGYRRHGHNETDEPRFTQPVMYGAIDPRPPVRDLFAAQLIEAGDLTQSDLDAMIAERRETMMAALTESRTSPARAALPALTESVWSGYVGGADGQVADVETRLPLERLQGLVQAITRVPEGFEPQSKIARLYEARARFVDPDLPFNWEMGEALAFASLLSEGRSIRLTGQDSRRGTFSHRHAFICDHRTGEAWTPYTSVAAEGARFQIWDSALSEAAVLAYEYGYSLEAPQGLVAWEAQFGDFVNGAQVIIDQFIASGEDKWNRLTGLTMLLPHGFEGQGPEHSYAHLDRFLALCAEDNMQVVECTSPAQFFHLLRRQVLRPIRKPLVVMAPKSVLRHKSAVSTLRDLAEGGFQRVIPDVSGIPAANARRVILCSGRVYFDLHDARVARGLQNVHIVRLEQLYPLDLAGLTAVLSQYGAGTDLVWVQDEPWNKGAWFFIKAQLGRAFQDAVPLRCVSREESASPATGSGAAHKLENRLLLDSAFEGL